MYTGTAYLSALVDIINIILIVALFQEYKIDHKTPDKTQLDKQKGKHIVMYDNIYLLMNNKSACVSIITCIIVWHAHINFDIFYVFVQISNCTKGILLINAHT